MATADCKGVVMRKPSALADDEPQAGACKALECATLDSEKTVNKGCKKMAVLGSAYTIAPYVRTPEEVLEALFRARNTPPETEDIGLRPTPLSKYIRASLRRDDADTLKPAHAEIFSWLAEEVEHRSPEGPVSTVLLMDGQKSLWNAAQAHLGSGSSIEILDLLHANSYVWKAAKLLHPNTKLEGLIFFVKPRIKRILHGEVEGVVQGLRAMGTRRGLKGKRLKKLKTFEEYGLRFDIEENFLDDKSNGFQLESSQIRDPAALTRLCLVLAVATLFLVSQGTQVVEKVWVDPHWFRGLSYLKIGWRWVKQASINLSGKLIQTRLCL